MSEIIIKAWVTKYALTEGILEVTGKHNSEWPRMLTVDNHGNGYRQHFHGPDWHRTREAAVRRANAMRDKKVAALMAQVEKVAKLRFE